MSGRSKEETQGVTLLGNQGTKYPDNYAPEVLDTFINKHQDNDYFVKFNCPEFTSLCPITGQPDFATITISYVPDVRMVESKSLKLYLNSFNMSCFGKTTLECLDICKLKIESDLSEKLKTEVNVCFIDNSAERIEIFNDFKNVVKKRA